MIVDGEHYRTVWLESGTVRMIDQPQLPHRFSIHDCPTYRDTAEAIRTMVTRGAGALGVAGGYAMAQAAMEAPDDGFRPFLDSARKLICSTRPTAQNLFYCVARVGDSIADGLSRGQEAARAEAVLEAERLADEDVEAARTLGEAGARLIEDGARILTHCNAGWLAFADWGTALSPIYAAVRQQKRVFVWVDETRPRLQGARLTAWELGQEGVPHRVIADNAAGHYMRTGQVDLVLVGADRIACNGDFANKIGTYEKAVVARENDVAFYVAAPLSTVDWHCADGDGIPIEERGEDEVLWVAGQTSAGELERVRIAPESSSAANPAFDVTPARYVTAFITERGVCSVDSFPELRPS